MKKTTIRTILKVLRVGSVAALIAMAAFFLAVCAVVFYVDTATACGYTAVFEFVLATLFVAGFLLAIYVLGAWVVIKGKFAK